MNISINWLKQYVDINDISIEDLASAITLAGLEVEGIKATAKVTNVVTAQCLTREKHPNADKLNLCTVTDGTDTYQVVCGAPNIEAGQKIAFAKVGAELPEIKIKEAKIRDIQSFGMICSESELGIDGDSSGIMVLPSDTELGLDINDILGLGDTIFELNVTPNRPDWLSAIGVAREVAAVLNKPLSDKVKLPTVNSNDISDITVDVKEIDKCPIYIAKVIKGIKVAPSPFWLQARLRAMGVRAINNVVDVTNYVLMEYGQPLHAFDIKSIDKGIVVRNANQGEKLVALDEKEYELDSDMLVIADNSKALAIAGVMGGEYSGVNSDTDTVVLECAYFEPTTVRRTSKKLGLSSDSSYRFERGIDHGATEQIAEYAANLLAEICGGEVIDGRAGKTYKAFEMLQVIASVSEVNNLLGTTISSEDMASYLNRLQVPTVASGVMLSVDVPTFRSDIYRMQDVAEEVARMFGYDNIETTVPALRIDAEPLSKPLADTRAVRNILADLGFSEAVNYSFMGVDYLKMFDSNEDDYVKLLNPISSDMAWLRTLVFPSVLKNLQTNRNQGYTNIRLFELAFAYKSNGADKLATETQKLCLGVMGDFMPLSWIGDAKVDTFYYLKGIVDNVLSYLNVKADYTRLSDVAYMHPGKSAIISINGENIGFLGALHPEYMETLDMKAPVYIAEIDFEKLSSLSNASKFEYTKFSRFPYVERDLAVIVKSDISSKDVLDVAKSIDKLVHNVVLFDDYSGKGIDDGYKSIAFRLVFSDITKTLSDDEINPILDKILSNLKDKFGAELR